MGSPLPPAALPVDLFANERLLRALAGRDFGVVFYVLHAFGVSYTKIAEACELKTDRVSRLARGEGEITSLPVIERIADGLRIPGPLLGLAERPWESTAVHAMDGDDPMKRRLVLRGALAAGLSTAGLAALAEARRSVDMPLTSSTSGDISLWEAAAEQYGYGYNGRPPAERLADLATDFRELRPLLDRPLTVSERTRVCRATAQLAGMTAIVLHDMGDRREASAWFHTAARAADESRDRALHAWVVGRHAMVPLNYGAPRAAAEQAAKAQEIAGAGPSASAALAAVVAARAYALARQPDEARAALKESERITARLTREDQADTWFGLPEEKIHVHLSQALLHLGETRRARESQERALELCSATSRISPALLQLDRALCLHREGDVEAACQQAVSVLQDLPEAYHKGLLLERAREVHRQVPSRQRTLSDARQLGELVKAV
ncbi:hypothetical protein ABZ419_02740 [Streptomyces cinnamoneus]|uniref:hypothetical protein n=1 Tax=Streptomyces cinnamoneus TaxID=53446 RepID=UPI0033E6BFD2